MPRWPRSIGVTGIVAAVAFGAAGFVAGRLAAEASDRDAASADAASDANADAALSIVDATAAPDAVAPHPRERHVFWSTSGSLVATSELSACGPPGGDCRETSAVSVIDVAARNAEHRRADAEILGFRADEWLVLRERASHALVEWSPRTDATRVSAFAERTHDVKSLWLSPDDDRFVAILESGGTVLRSRTTGASTELPMLAYAPLTPTDCAFSPDGKSFVLVDGEHVALYRVDAKDPVRSFPLAGARNLAWSGDGTAVSFFVKDGVDDVSFIVYVWNVDRAVLSAHVTSGPARPHPRRAEMLVRSRCAWYRRSADGKSLGNIGPEPETCFHVHHHDVAISPTGSFAASIEGEWGGRGLVLLPLPQ